MNMETVHQDLKAYLHAAAMAVRELLVETGDFSNLAKGFHQWSTLRAMEDDFARDTALVNLSRAMTLLAGYALMGRQYISKLPYGERAAWGHKIDTPIEDGIEYVLLRL